MYKTSAQGGSCYQAGAHCRIDAICAEIKIHSKKQPLYKGLFFLIYIGVCLSKDIYNKKAEQKLHQDNKSDDRLERAFSSFVSEDIHTGDCPKRSAKRRKDKKCPFGNATVAEAGLHFVQCKQKKGHPIDCHKVCTKNIQGCRHAKQK
jgi:hypothetical protein